MGILRLASTASKRIDLGDGDYLDVREDISKRDFNKVLAVMPANFDAEKGLNPKQADEFTSALFDMLVTGWSLDVDASVENYQALDRNAGLEVDKVLVAQFNDLTPDKEESSKSKGPSKSKPTGA